MILHSFTKHVKDQHRDTACDCHSVFRFDFKIT
jgi:hypothetical protein